MQRALTDVLVYGIPHLDRDTLKRLKNLEHFSDFMLLTWAVAEVDIEIMFINQFDIHYIETKSKKSREFLEKASLIRLVEKEAKKAEFLLDHIQTGARIELLKQMGIFTEEEKKVISQLVADRKSLFHGKQWQPNVLARSDSEKVRMMDNAHRAAFVILGCTLKTVFPDLKPPINPADVMDAPPGQNPTTS